MQRYFRAVLKEGQPIICALTIDMVGTFNMSTAAEHWKAFTSQQRGGFMRFFAEAAWDPTALLPSQGVRWEAVDDRSANATIVDGPLTLTLLFRFNHAGLIDSVRAEARGAMVGNKVVMMPWECTLLSYEVRDRITVKEKLKSIQASRGARLDIAAHLRLQTISLSF